METQHLIRMRRQIAYMMGAEPYQDANGGMHEFLVMFGMEMWGLTSLGWDASKTLNYDQSYNLLMAAVEFIESLGYVVNITGQTCYISRLTPHYYRSYLNSVSMPRKINVVFQAVYDFAIIYNSKERALPEWAQ